MEAERRDAVWEERFRVLEARLKGDPRVAEPNTITAPSAGGSMPAGDAGKEGSTSMEHGVSTTSLGKRRERDSDSSTESQTAGLLTSHSALGSPTKRPRNGDRLPTSSTGSSSGQTRDPLDILAQRSSSPSSKSPRTPSPGKSSSHADQDMFQTPQLPTSVPKQQSTLAFSQPARTPSPGHQGVLPDYSATPGFANDASYFAGLPMTGTITGRFRGHGHKGDTDEPLPFPLFATTPRPAAPTSPTTDAPPSTIRRKRAHSGVNPSLLLTPGRRPSRTVSHAHMELSSVTESPKAAVDTAVTANDGPGDASKAIHETPAPDSDAALATPVRPSRPEVPEPPSPPHPPVPLKSARKAPPVTAHRRIESVTFAQAPLPLLGLGPELASEVGAGDVPRLSPSPSITETRFSTLAFPTNRNAPRSVSVSAPTLGTSPTLAAGGSRSTATEHIMSQDNAAGESVQSRSSPIPSPAVIARDFYTPPQLQNRKASKIDSAAPAPAPTTPKPVASSSADALQGEEDLGGLGFGISANAGLGMTTPGHRTMLGTESYRDTRFGDQPMTMSWGTPEMPETPYVAGSGSRQRNKPPQFS